MRLSSPAQGRPGYIAFSGLGTLGQMIELQAQEIL